MVSGAGWKRSMNQSFRRIKKTTTSSYNLTKAPHEETGEAPPGDWFQTSSSSRLQVRLCYHVFETSHTNRKKRLKCLKENQISP